MEKDFSINNLKITTKGLVLEIEGSNGVVKTISMSKFLSLLRGESYAFEILQEFLQQGKLEIFMDSSFYSEEKIEYIITEKGEKLIDALQNNNIIMYEYLQIIHNLGAFTRNELATEIYYDYILYIILIDDMIYNLLKYGLIEMLKTKMQREKAKRKYAIDMQKIKSYVQGHGKPLIPQQISQQSLINYCQIKNIPYSQTSTKSHFIDLIQEYKLKKRQQLKKKTFESTKQKVFDAFQGDFVSVDTFLKEDNNIIIYKNGKFYGFSLKSGNIFYPCVPDLPFHEYIDYFKENNDKSLFKLRGDIDVCFKRDELRPLIQEGYNVFHVNQDKNDVKIISRQALGPPLDFISRAHCQPQDVTKISRIKKHEKKINGLRMTSEVKRIFDI